MPLVALAEQLDGAAKKDLEVLDRGAFPEQVGPRRNRAKGRCGRETREMIL
jgi:hypothetical protein